MEFWDVVAARRSTRRFRTDLRLPEDLVRKLLEAAASAPSAGNRQPWHFYAVHAQETKKRLAEAAYGQDFVADAPVVIVVCADPNRSAARYASRGEELYCIQDTAIAATYIMLGATDLGLGVCWVGAFDEGRAASALQLPAHLRPVAIMPVGYAATQPETRTSRRPSTEVITTLD